MSEQPQQHINLCDRFRKVCSRSTISHLQSKYSLYYHCVCRALVIALRSRSPIKTVKNTTKSVFKSQLVTCLLKLVLKDMMLNFSRLSKLCTLINRD